MWIALHKKHRVYLDYVGVENYPDDYETRLQRAFTIWDKLRLWILEPHDLALTKLERSVERDVRDVMFLARAGLIDPETLVARFAEEMEAYITGRTPNWHRTRSVCGSKPVGQKSSRRLAGPKLVDMVLVLFALVGFFALEATDSSPLDQGYSAMYNLDFNGAHRAFGEFQKQQPADPFGPASQAAAYLFAEFERLKVLRSEFFAEDKSFLGAPKLKADPAVKALFEKALNQSHTLSEQMLKEGKTPENAMFAAVVCTALRADYLAMIEKENWQALNEIKEARVRGEALIAKHPEMKDAYLAVGVENYLLSQKGAPVRIFLRMTGAQTDKEMGIQKLKIVAAEGRYFKPYAKILLAIAAVRDKNRAGAEKLMVELAREFPGNSLFKEEIKKLSCTANC